MAPCPLQRALSQILGSVNVADKEVGLSHQTVSLGVEEPVEAVGVPSCAHHPGTEYTPTYTRRPTFGLQRPVPGCALGGVHRYDAKPYRRVPGLRLGRRCTFVPAYRPTLPATWVVIVMRAAGTWEQTLTGRPWIR